MNYNKQLLIDRCWWNKKTDTPFDSLIKGNKSTRLNLGWFKLINSVYELTVKGERNYIILLILKVLNFNMEEINLSI